MKIIVFGSGHWGENLIKTLHELGVLYAICDLDEGKLQKFKSLYPDVRIELDPDSALSLPCDGVVIATPANTHYSLAKKSLKKNKPTFVEKPITLDVAEAAELVALAQKSECPLMVGHLLLYQDGVQKIKTQIESGAIGSLRAIHIKRLKLGRVRKVENVLWSFGVHDIAVMLHLVNDRVKDVSVVGHRFLQPKIEDDVYLHLVFNSGVHGHLHTSWYWPNVSRGMTVLGEDGMLVFDELSQRVTLHRKSIGNDLTSLDQGEVVISEEKHNVLKTELAHFLECAKNRTRPISDGYSGLEVVRVLERASRQLGDQNELLHP